MLSFNFFSLILISCQKEAEKETETSDTSSELLKKTIRAEQCFLPPLPDQFERVKKYYRESLQAEEKCNASVSGPLSPVEQSNETRKITEELLEARKDEFLKNVTANNQSLNDLQQEVHNLDKDIQDLSQKVGRSKHV